MRRLFLFSLVLALAACAKPTYEQRRVVEEACNSVGMQSRTEQFQIRCWS